MSIDRPRRAAGELIDRRHTWDHGVLVREAQHPLCLKKNVNDSRQQCSLRGKQTKLVSGT